MESIVIFILFSNLIAFSSCETPTVKTTLGTIIGETKSSAFRGRMYNVDQFLGIPYARPPVGDWRFKKPEPYGEFKEPFEATKHGSPCPQTDSLDIGLRSTNEDCLFLNIYVPHDKPNRSGDRAVMVFIHGGGFALGSGDLTPGDVLAWFGNVIVVTLNYRLGMFGFLNIDKEHAPGNQGLWDQHFALLWIKENINAFGGDSSRVTIFGESAGAVSVTLQSIFPQNRGLFQNVIAQSGTFTMPLSSLNNNLNAAKFLAETLECSNESSTTILKCLQEVSAERLIGVYEEHADDPNFLMAAQFFPTIDGEFCKRDPNCSDQSF